MRPIRSLITLIAWITVFSSLGRPTIASAQLDPDAAAIKFLNFLIKNETTWPKKVAPGKRNPAKVLILGDERLEEAYKAIIRDDKDKSLPVTVVPRSNITPGSLEGLHLIYFGEGTTREEYELLDHLDGKPTLTVGVSNNFLDRGGMMLFRMQKRGQDRVHVNLDRINKSGLKIGARFLQLTTIAKP